MSLKTFTAKLGRFIAETAAVTASTALVFKFVVQPSMGVGSSMEPTLQDGDIILEDKISPRLGWIRKGDIVALRHPLDERFFIGKRVAGMPGDVVTDSFWWTKVPPGHIWLLGDNSEESTDSRDFGPVPASSIVSRYLCRVWPTFTWLPFHPLQQGYDDADGQQEPGDTKIPLEEKYYEQLL